MASLIRAPGLQTRPSVNSSSRQGVCWRSYIQPQTPLASHGSRTLLANHRQITLCQAVARERLSINARQSQSGNAATKRRTSGPPKLPPIDDNGGGGGGGGGWNWERSARNLLPNLAFLGLYFAITSFGGDGWNGNFFGGGDSGGGGGGGGGGGWGSSGGGGGGSSSNNQVANDDQDDEDHRKDSNMVPAYCTSYSYGSTRSAYR